MVYSAFSFSTNAISFYLPDVMQPKPTVFIFATEAQRGSYLNPKMPFNQNTFIFLTTFIYTQVLNGYI